MSASDFDEDLGPVLSTTRVVAASAESARERLSRVDAYVENQSRFDRQSRTGVPAEAFEVNRVSYLRYLTTQVRAWSDAEVSTLRRVVEVVRKRFQSLDVYLPPTVALVKTTGEEEGFAAYTRGMDTIVLPRTRIPTLRSGGGGADALHPEPDVGALEDLVTHEFFHLISKNNPELRRRLYEVVGYEQFDPPLQLPDVPWADGRMPDLKITNPDTPELNVFIRMTFPGQDEPRPLLPVLLSRSRYRGGVFFEDLEWWFMAVRRRGPDWEPVLRKNDTPMMIEAEAVMDRYLDLVGSNLTEEIFHPDEILAQNFVLLMSRPDLSLLGRMRGCFDAVGA